MSKSLTKITLNFYLFLFVFSLSLPVFYHSTFLVGFLASFHLLIYKYRRNQKIQLNPINYVFRFIIISIVGYVVISIYPIIYGTGDYTYFKTYTNSFLSSLCGIPLAYLFVCYFKNDTYSEMTKSLFTVFFIQSLIIFLVLFIPQLKPIIEIFHRNPDVVRAADIFSNGIRSNALSGGLFFGLSLSFSVVLIIYIHYFIRVSINNISIVNIIKIFLVNIAMLISGRFGAIYLISIVFILNSRFSKVLKIISKLLVLCFFISLLFAVFLFVGKDINIDNNITNYIFEFFKNGHQMNSTTRLAEMYNIDLPFSSFVMGTGHYTGEDGSYYMHTDVGYLRLLIYGGVSFLLFSFLYTLNLLSPLFNYEKKQLLGSLWLGLLILYLVSSFKGEVMMTLVSVNSMIFFVCLIVSILKSDQNNDGRKNS
ncbi:hypothetical protein [Photobacterium piscicola]|uniref:hypothetical protein n=1 Tax=Photobacterium piscicola TaxID=1378299 RepID=UPI0038D1204C